MGVEYTCACVSSLPIRKHPALLACTRDERAGLAARSPLLASASSSATSSSLRGAVVTRGYLPLGCCDGGTCRQAAGRGRRRAADVLLCSAGGAQARAPHRGVRGKKAGASFYLQKLLDFIVI